MKYWLALVACLLLECVPMLGQASTRDPLRIGYASREANYRSRFETVLNWTFDTPLGPWNGQQGVQWQSPGEVLLTGDNARLSVPADLVSLEPFQTYVVRYSYRIEGACRSTDPPVAVFQRPDGREIDLGRGPGSFPDRSGEAGTSFRAGSGGPTLLHIERRDCDFALDNLFVERLDADVSPGTARILDMGFPRLSKYAITFPPSTALQAGTEIASTYELLSSFHMIHGLPADHTMESAYHVGRLRRLNPRLHLLAYDNAFKADYAPIPPLSDAAVLPLLFNRRLPWEWFLTDPAGNHYNSPDFPYLVQLNHTPLAPKTQGRSLADFKAAFLTGAILSTGLWDGIHFDQPEHYPNPLLQPRSLPLGTPPPPLDLNQDGEAESLYVIYSEWRKGFFDYFSKMSTAFGHQYTMLGNAGYIHKAQDVLPYLNGWTAEIVSPYLILPNGDWLLDEAAGWYRLINNYLTADQVARAPGLVSLQFHGQGLGQTREQLTPNGLPDREPVLEARDYQRMRLGLGTALLGNGFFGYDYVDNTSLPVWFDEYAVDPTGKPSNSLEHRGYLGQPLEAAQELSSPVNPILQVDFDSTPPPAFQPGPGFRISSDASESAGSGASMIVYRGPGNEGGTIFSTNPGLLPFIPGKTYQVLMDYRVLLYGGGNFNGLLALTLTNFEDGIKAERTASLFQPDVIGEGQRGTLRTVVKVARDGYLAAGIILENAAIAVDNIRVIEGGGGIWRRDFENGIVLVNPGPDEQSIGMDALRGPRNRTNIRRILGSQARLWNNGQPLNAPLVLPPGDAIVLLADRLPSPPLPVVSRLRVAVRGDSLEASWTRPAALVAGYRIEYGPTITDLRQQVIAGSIATAAALPIPPPGQTSYFRIAAYDFLGRLGPLSDAAVFTNENPGFPTRSYFLQESRLSPGSIAVLRGSFPIEAPRAYQTPIRNAGRYRVLVNGIPAPVVFESPLRLDVLVPWEVANGRCLFQYVEIPPETDPVSANTIPLASIPSPAVEADCVSTVPQWMLRQDQERIQAIDAAGRTIGPENPARPGTKVRLLAVGLGRLTFPVPQDEPLDARGLGASVATNLRVSDGTNDWQVEKSGLLPGEPGVYEMTVVVPGEVNLLPESGAPLQLTIQAGDRVSRPGRLSVSRE